MKDPLVNTIAALLETQMGDLSNDRTRTGGMDNLEYNLSDHVSDLSIGKPCPCPVVHRGRLVCAARDILTAKEFNSWQI